MSFDTLQVNTLQHATKPVWEIFDWMGTDTSGVVAYSDKTVNDVDYDNPNINNHTERIIGSQYAFDTGDDISGNFVSSIKLDRNIPLTTLSYNLYGTTHLWWLILVVNKIQNPVKNLPVGYDIKYVKKNYIKTVISSITNQLQ